MDLAFKTHDQQQLRMSSSLKLYCEIKRRRFKDPIFVQFFDVIVEIVFLMSNNKVMQVLN